MAFDAIILAASEHRSRVILGLTLVERGRRLAAKVGARRILVIESGADAEGLAAWDAGRGDAGLLVLRAGDQLVHVPLVKPLLDGSGPRRIAVGPAGELGGALYCEGPADEVIAAIAADPTGADTAIAARWADATRIAHGDIARHMATTPAERRGAKKMLLRILVKQTEDSPISKYIYRPLSRPLTQLLLKTPITANQVSYFVGVLGLFGCWLTAQYSQAALIWGAALVFASGIIDGCDGEISRLRLTSSAFGAWLDTVVDELTTFSYLMAIGYHTYLHYPEAWVGASLPIGAACYLTTVYSIYYFCIVVLKAGGSQYYQGDLEIVDGPDGAMLRPKHKPPSKLPVVVQKIGVLGMYMIRRDFINLAAWGLTFANAFEIIYGTMWVGGVVAAVIIIPEHLRLRRQLRELARRGATCRYVAA